MWKKSNPDGADQVMYVGSSANGVRRLSGHHALPLEYADDDYIELYPCTSMEDAWHFEADLINSLKPLLNKNIPKIWEQEGRLENQSANKDQKRRYLKGNKRK